MLLVQRSTQTVKIYQKVLCHYIGEILETHLSVGSKVLFVDWHFTFYIKISQLVWIFVWLLKIKIPQVLFKIFINSFFVLGLNTLIKDCEIFLNLSLDDLIFPFERSDAWSESVVLLNYFSQILKTFLKNGLS